MKILVPIDGSYQSEKSLDYAVNLQQCLINDNNKDSINNSNKKKKEIIVLSVIPHSHVPLGFEHKMKSLKSGANISLTDYVKEMNEAIELEWKDRLSDIKKKYESPEISIRTELLPGDNGSISENIIRFADKENVELIVIGNIGLGGISRIKALGSVSRQVSESANCPVLIVH